MNALIQRLQARQIVFIEHKFNITLLDPKCFTIKITEFKKDRKGRQQKVKPVFKKKLQCHFIKHQLNYWKYTQHNITQMLKSSKQ